MRGRTGGILHRWWSAAAFVLPLCLYLSTLAPSVTFYDSGEFLSAVHWLGSAHSPGYPLFLLFAKPFTWLPFGSIAFRVNLATAVSAALACWSVFLLVRTLLARTDDVDDGGWDELLHNSAALAGALLFAVTPRLWLQTNHDKPYPLLAFLVALAIYCLLRWRQDWLAGENRPAWWYTVGLLTGLASGAHQTIVLMIPAFVVFVASVDHRALLRVRDLVLTVTMTLVGGAVQLYLPLRAAAGTRQNWGDVDALSRFLWHVLRKGYPEEAHGRDVALLLKQMAAFSVPHEFGWLGLLLFIAGVVYCWRFERYLVYTFAAALVCFWSVIAGVFNPQPDVLFLTEEFYTPLYLCAATLVAVGLYGIIAWGSATAERPERCGLQHRVLVLVPFLLPVLFQGWQQYPLQNQRANYVAHDYAVNSLRVLPEQAVLFTWGDSGAFPLWYLQGVERLREDIDLPHIPHLGFAWYRRELPRLLEQETGREAGLSSEAQFLELAVRMRRTRPVYIDYSTRHSVQWEGGGEPVACGFQYLFPGVDAGSASERMSVWRNLTWHRFADVGGWPLDQDSDKAVMILAHSMLQAGEDAAKLEQRLLAAELLAGVWRLAPAWRPTVELQQRRLGLRDNEAEGRGR